MSSHENHYNGKVLSHLRFSRERGLTCHITVERFAGTQAFGGMSLKDDDEDLTGWWIERLLDVLDLGCSTEICGKPVRIAVESNRITGIGHFLEDKWFYPDKEVDDYIKKLKEKRGYKRSINEGR